MTVQQYLLQTTEEVVSCMKCCEFGTVISRFHFELGAVVALQSDIPTMWPEEFSCDTHSFERIGVIRYSHGHYTAVFKLGCVGPIYLFDGLKHSGECSRSSWPAVAIENSICIYFAKSKWNNCFS
jgi:hypothetical protein